MTILCTALFLGSALSVDETLGRQWDAYVHEVCTRDIIGVLDFQYSSKLAGRMRAREIPSHLEEVFVLLCRDYDHRIVETRAGEKRAVMTVRFQRRNDPDRTFEQEVSWVLEERGWRIDSPPELPRRWLQRTLDRLGPPAILVGGAALCLAAVFLLSRFVLWPFADLDLASLQTWDEPRWSRARAPAPRDR